jgi:hypothetical protein
MVSASLLQGIVPCDPPTAQPVCRLVTPSLRNPIFYPFCFQTLAHSCENEKSTTPLISEGSALFAQNTGGRYLPHDLPLVFMDLHTLADFVHAGLLIGFRLHKLSSFSLPPGEQEIRAWRTVFCFSLITEHWSRNTTLIRAFQSLLRALCGKFVFSVAFLCNFRPSMSRRSTVVQLGSLLPCFIPPAPPCYPWRVRHV